MRAICVDDEPLLAERIAKLCGTLDEIEEALSFTHAEPALAWLNDNQADLALLDIDMPDMNGIELAKIIKLRFPKMKILFLTYHGFEPSSGISKKMEAQIKGLRGDMFCVSESEWKAIGGKYYYDTGEERELYGEKQSSWDEFKADGDGLFPYASGSMRLKKK